MASPRFTSRGGNDAEYEIYKALYSTGRREPQDFVSFPPEMPLISFFVFNPRVGIRVGSDDGVSQLLSQSLGPDAPRVESIEPSAALADGRGALLSAIGG